MVPGVRPGKRLAIASQDSPSSFSRRIFASSSGIHLALLELDLALAVVVSLFMYLVLFCGLGAIPQVVGDEVVRIPRHLRGNSS